jgi:hypothetical protein
LLSFSLVAALPQQAAAWGDDGRKVVALVAQHYLTPTAKKQVDAMLTADADPLTQHDIASEATWADRYRDSNNRRDHYDATKRWHFVDLEITDPDMKAVLQPRAAARWHAGVGRRQERLRGRQDQLVRRRA